MPIKFAQYWPSESFNQIIEKGVAILHSHFASKRWFHPIGQHTKKIEQFSHEISIILKSNFEDIFGNIEVVI